MYFNPFVKNIFYILPSVIKKIYYYRNSFIYLLSSSYYIPFFVLFRYHSNYRYVQLLDMFSVDYYKNSSGYRYGLFYVLQSVTYNSKIFVKLFYNFKSPVISMTFVYESANWLEREVWDMMGLYFQNHPDMRRILTDYGFKGFPLRKDFPLVGYTHLVYDYSNKRCIYKNLSLTQIQKK
uniref:NADH dehydrogenase subunit 9 n=1 Tax=Acavomonas peruviana TaxID=1542312 RepID=V5KVI2_9ALVE|nr:NADH dehydrogenase subunit 9 [Acavomonas peruviana]AHA41675.1 NADH dehydrogenase subunit 9 [Acavomonas peruviana]